MNPPIRTRQLRRSSPTAAEPAYVTVAQGRTGPRTENVVLIALTDHPDGRLRLFELGRVLGWEKSRLSHQVARMAERGLVKKQKCDSDRRGAYVAVTPKGRKEIEAAAPDHVATVRRLFVDLLTAEQLDVIADAAEAVLAQLDRESAGA